MSDPIVVWHQHAVTREEREALNGHRGCVVWFTGLSGCGKSTVANLVDHKLHARGVHTFLLDGDNVRHGLNAAPQMLTSHGEAYAKLIPNCIELKMIPGAGHSVHVEKPLETARLVSNFLSGD